MLVDTDDKGIERCTSRRVVAKAVEYELNVLILATGFLVVMGENVAPAELFSIPVAGRSGRHLKDKYRYPAWHRYATNGLPKLLYPGLGDGPGSLNLTVVFDLESRHITNVLKETVGRVSDPTQLVIERTKEAENAWVEQVESRTVWYSVLLACTLTYFNHEGAALVHVSSDLEKRRQAMRRILHGGGIAVYDRAIRE
ncbi:hypothetical protein COCSADRAFT_158979 [Bipolaris sorokiniana ND90Pr]|nr:uncharacterized protein COCSADRAFT_158979 [Bipolaris sorokiniana ND90Pr]EMD65318.1 hypothetical protein COCSADRAFT_158979 [Bipolaris sorokiniana ND90Pr]